MRLHEVEKTKGLRTIEDLNGLLGYPGLDYEGITTAATDDLSNILDHWVVDTMPIKSPLD